MEYPNNGSVVIIDDKYSEVEGLIRILSSKGIPTTYFNGVPDEFIALHGTRIVFLDLDLKLGVQDTEEKTIISSAFSNIKQIIPNNNGDYILIIWSSKESSYGQIVKDEIRKVQSEGAPLLNEFPLEILSISKYDVGTLRGQNIEFDIKKIKDKINDILPDNSILNLMNIWENKVLNASKQVISNFSDLANSEDEKKKLLALFADSSTPSGNLDKDNILEPAITPLSSLLSDQLLTNVDIGLENIATELLANIGNKVDIDIVSRINTFYHIDSNENEEHLPGSVYKYQDYMTSFSCSSKDCNTKWAENLSDPMKNEIKIKVDKYIKLQNGNNEYEVTNSERTIEKDNIQDNTIPIFLEFTPGCDYVQNHRKKLRLIFGLMFPVKDGITIELSKNKGSYLQLPFIVYQEKCYSIILNLLTITGINEDAFSGMNPIFKLRKELLVDIQQKIATHISRPGFFNMNDYLA